MQELKRHGFYGNVECVNVLLWRTILKVRSFKGGGGILPQSPRHHFSLTNYIKSIEQAITPAVLITKHIFVTYQNQGVITAPFPICVVSCVHSYCIAMLGLAEPIDRPILDDVDSNSDSKPRQSDRV